MCYCCKATLIKFIVSCYTGGGASMVSSGLASLCYGCLLLLYLIVLATIMTLFNGIDILYCCRTIRFLSQKCNFG